MTIDTNELRRLAQAATPGPWYVTGKLTRYVEARIDGRLIQEVAACGPTKADGGYGPQQEANARLIAAANPATISELLDRIEAAEKERYALRAENAGLVDDMNLLRDNNTSLRAKIAEMEQQAPVMWANSSNINSSRINKERGGSGDQHTCSETQTTYHDAPLYALHGAQGEEK